MAEETLRQRTESSVAFKPIFGQNNETAGTAIPNATRIMIGSKLPESVTFDTGLELVQSIGAGMDGFNRNQLPDGAYLCNVYRHGRSVAEHAFALLLAVRRRHCGMGHAFRNGAMTRQDDHRGLFSELGEDTLGIVGYGQIGQRLVSMAQGFDMDVMAIRRTPGGDADTEQLSYLGRPDNIDTVLKSADVVVVAVPLTSQTKGLIGADELSTMHEDVILINVARGPIVRESALFSALEDGTIGGAGIDVWYDSEESEEGSTGSQFPFETLDNEVATPHVAGWSTETWDHRWTVIAENINRVVDGMDPINVVYKPKR